MKIPDVVIIVLMSLAVGWSLLRRERLSVILALTAILLAALSLAGIGGPLL